MAQKKQKIGTKSFSPPEQLQHSLREGGLLLILAMSLFLLVSLVSFNIYDPGWSHTGEVTQLFNMGGRVGAWLADIALYLFGYMAYCLPFMVAYIGWILLRKSPTADANSLWFGLRFISFLLLFVAGSGLASIHFAPVPGSLPIGVFAGGLLGDAVGGLLIDGFNTVGATFFLLALFLSNMSLFFGISWLWLMDKTGFWTLQFVDWATAQSRQLLDRGRGEWQQYQGKRVSTSSATATGASTGSATGRRKAPLAEPVEVNSSQSASVSNNSSVEANDSQLASTSLANGSAEPSLADLFVSSPDKSRIEPVIDLPDAPLPEVDLNDSVPAVAAPPVVAKLADAPKTVGVEAQNSPLVQSRAPRQVPLFESRSDGALPPLELLDKPDPHQLGYTPEVLEAMSRLLEQKLGDYNIQVQVTEVHPGPVITRFELQPAPGVKSSQIGNLAKDIARSLSLVSVRVVEVIPGKSTIGLEVPNEKREIVHLCEIIGSEKYAKSLSPLTLAMGKDIGGHPIIANLAKMPHLLVAGTTGSGKSVAVNAMLLSLLYKSQPKDVRLILIDPKMLELNVYEGIPHLLAPVVTDMKEAANALRWCVAEMERRYRLMAAMGVRNIGGFNQKVLAAITEGEPLKDPLYDPETAFDPSEPAPDLETLPYIVVVVDEFADMMMVVGKKVEELIARIAQKARAAGIHLILATQRPSVDVITGLIKANIPTRVAFQVSSKIDSRTIIDQMGAEQLLGHGDMLYLPPGTAHPVRVHGAFVDDHEVHNVVEHLKKNGEACYIDEILNEPQAGAGMLPGEAGDSEQDALYDQAVAIVTESRKGSISYVQRRLKIGYNRAARMIEDMEAAGVVGPVQNNGSREVLAAPPPEG